MNIQSVEIPQQSTIKSSCNVLVEYQPEGRVKASVFGWPECHVEAQTKEEALQQLQPILTQRLRDHASDAEHYREMVSLEIQVPASQPEHPWMKFAGKFFDGDREFEEFMADIQAYRKEVDADMEEYYHQMDADKKA